MPAPAVAPSFAADGGPDADNAPMPQVALPPMPALPPIPQGNPPPTAVVGVIGVPEVMRASVAAQAVDKVIGERREKLNEDAQKEQAAWRDLQQTLANQASTISPEQKRAREIELQTRIANAQKQFRDRARIIQEAAQYGVNQIERSLVAVIRQVAESHGMNLVLHRSQVALNMSNFDITDEVTNQLNKVLSSVVIPPDGMALTDMPPQPAEVVTPTSGAPVLPGPRP
jgi:Skp family chaperone for outer membrane proteins